MKTGKKTVIMVFGTFDPLHKGHLNFFKQARALAPNPHLIVSVARDENVKRLKGKKPWMDERSRLGSVGSSALVDQAVLGNKRKYISHISKYRPRIIALGYDQTHYTRNLQSRLQSAGIKAKVVRLNPYKPLKYKSSLLKAESKYEKPK